MSGRWRHKKSTGAEADTESADVKRKRGLEIIGLLIALPAAVAAGIGIAPTVSQWFEPPTYHVVVDPRIGFGGLEVLATPESAPAPPVDYLRAGTPLSVDCLVRVPVEGGQASLLRISKGSVDAGRWVDRFHMLTPDGKPAASMDLPTCS